MGHAETWIDGNAGDLHSGWIHTACDRCGTSGSAGNARQVDATVQPYGVWMFVGHDGYYGRLKFAS